MNLPTRLLPLFGLTLCAIVTVNCAQPGAREGVSPTGPSSVAHSSVSGDPSVSAAGQSAGYDATGTWCVVNTDAHGNPVDDPVEQLFTQEPGTGDLLFMDEGQLVRAERLSNGQGKTITYRIDFISNEGGECNLGIKGTILLDTRTNTFTSSSLRLTSLCSNEKLGVGVIGTKGNCPAE